MSSVYSSDQKTLAATLMSPASPHPASQGIHRPDL